MGREKCGTVTEAEVIWRAHCEATQRGAGSPRNGPGVGHPLEVRVRGHEFASCQRDGGGVSAQLGTPSPLDAPPNRASHGSPPLPGTLQQLSDRPHAWHLGKEDRAERTNAALEF